MSYDVFDDEPIWEQTFEVVWPTIAMDASMISNGARNVVIDLRCLQDPNYARRGIGRHTLALIRQAATKAEDVRLVGLADRNLPPLIEEAQSVITETYTNAYAAFHALESRGGVEGYIVLSPMTHDPLFGARFLTDDTIVKASVVYDFIPSRWPERYLPTPSSRLEHAIGLRWLARCDLFAPISESAASDLVEILKVPRASIAVTGAPLDSMFDDDRVVSMDDAARHFLVVGGDDPRKNPDLVIVAHARSKLLQKARTPLIIGGHYPLAEIERCRALVVEAGGDPSLVDVPGGVPEDRLLAMYRQAIAVVCPSFDEGFSLPVVEAMASGVPALVSNIPAHQELVEDPALRFPPESAEQLAPLLERMVTDPGWRSAAIAQQASVWPNFRAAEVGRRFWAAFEACRRPKSPSVRRHARPRVAMLSPLPPDRSGVADYTAATCAELGRLVDLHVFSETHDATPIPSTTIHPFSALPSLAPGFDRIIHVLGNSHFHLRTFEVLLRYGGAAIAHDARMLGFYRILLGQHRALAVASLELGRLVDEAELQTWMDDEAHLKAVFLDEIWSAASPTIVHSRITAERLKARHGRAPVFIPFSIYRPWEAEDLSPDARAQARARLGISPDEVSIITLGFVLPTKAPDECIWALDLLRAWGIPARLRFVGGLGAPEIGTHLRSLTASLGLTKSVIFADGFVSEEDYRDALISADVAIQLRTYGLGGLSGAILDCAAAGIPTVGNRSLVDAVEMPGGYVASIPDALSPVLLAEAVAGVIEARARKSAAEHEADRSVFCEQRSMASYASALCRHLDIPMPSARQGAST